MKYNMSKAQVFLTVCAALFSFNANALSPEALEGKALFPACDVCHNQAQDPALGPPMWGVQRRYRKNTGSDAEFIERMVSFVKAPTMEKAIHDQALGQLGLMPPMPLPDEILNKIVTYVMEEQFPPPCDHWKMAVRRAEEKGDPEHAKKDKRQLDRFCN